MSVEPPAKAIRNSFTIVGDHAFRLVSNNKVEVLRKAAPDMRGKNNQTLIVPFKERSAVVEERAGYNALGDEQVWAGMVVQMRSDFNMRNICAILNRNGVADKISEGDIVSLERAFEYQEIAR